MHSGQHTTHLEEGLSTAIIEVLEQISLHVFSSSAGAADPGGVEVLPSNRGRPAGASTDRGAGGKRWRGNSREGTPL